MKVLRKDYYEDDAAKIKDGGFDAEKLAINVEKKHYTGNTLLLNKKGDSYSTFDDGLLY
jgi:hypothetical protein